MHAAARGAIRLLRKVVGVEFSAELCRTAEQNIRRFQRHCAGSVTFEVVHADAADYEVQPDHNVFFMFNPFGPVVMEQVIQRVGQSLGEMPRRIWVIYLGLRQGCMSILAESGYKKAGRVNYGSAKVSIFVDDAVQIDPRSYSQARTGLAVSQGRITFRNVSRRSGA